MSECCCSLGQDGWVLAWGEVWDRLQSRGGPFPAMSPVPGTGRCVHPPGTWDRGRAGSWGAFGELPSGGSCPSGSWGPGDPVWVSSRWFEPCAGRGAPGQQRGTHLPGAGTFPSQPHPRHTWAGTNARRCGSRAEPAATQPPPGPRHCRPVPGIKPSPVTRWWQTVADMAALPRPAGQRGQGGCVPHPPRHVTPPCRGPGAGRSSVPARRHRVTLADHLPQLHSSAAQSRVPGAAEPFCFPGHSIPRRRPHAGEQPLPRGKPGRPPLPGRPGAFSLRPVAS